MFLLGMAAAILGYTMLYYSMGLWEYYRTSNPDMTALPLSVLLGFRKLDGSKIDAVKLPFDESNTSSGTGTGSNTSTPSGGTGGSGVQSV
jgi:hypothetical protein